MTMPTIYYLCGDDPDICGGLKVMYQHVDILNQHGYRAYILHEKSPYRATWFANQTSIVYLSDHNQIDQNSIVVMPEVMSFHIPRVMSGIRKVMFCQNPYYTFKRYGINSDHVYPYTDRQDVIGVMAISQDTMDFLCYAFPSVKPHRIYNSISSELFFPKKKKQQICFMPKKSPRDVINVINILYSRNAIKDYKLVSIDNMSEKDVAAILQESLIFLSFAREEGFGLPAAEAMACGCMAIGYPAMGGNEFFLPEFSYPIETGHIVDYVKAVEEAISLYQHDPSAFAAKCDAANHYIQQNYSVERQTQSVLDFWKHIFDENKC